jgi:uncharacterized NAD(P)/FAD-binding protein YdhS
MTARRLTPVCIVGGGFAGTMVAANLARHGVDSVLVECNGRTGQGAAYSTTDPAHLLNIPAETMGAWADEPEDFLKREGVERGSYAERRQFGRYLRWILDEAVGSGHTEIVDDRAVGAERESRRWTVRLGNGDVITADALVLATGNQPPARLLIAASAGDRLINDPWGTRAREAIEDSVARQLDVLILGTSLTMIDVALSLDSAGHRGRTVALSRRGKIPLANGVDTPSPIEADELPPPRIRDIAKWLRKRSADIGWRAAVDSLRPHSHRLWQSLSTEQKRLFLRYGRPWWDIHRHRIAPEVARSVGRMIANGRLEIVAGRLVKLRRDGEAVEVVIRRRGQEDPDPPQRFGYVFNCTGPLGDITGTEDTLLRQLLDQGLAVPDDVAIGLAVDERSRAGPAERLWALGTLAKGRYWEIIAVPDIRDQAAAVAEDIATELAR